MSSQDKLYQFIANYKNRLPFSRGNKPVKQFLREYFNGYINELKRVSSNRDESCLFRQEAYDLVSSKISVIEKLCDGILRCLEYYDCAKMETLYRHFDEMMNAVLPYLYIEHVSDQNFYRIRTSSYALNRKDLFHIPMDLRQIIKSYRYSIPGYPCLYLATGLQLSWFECGMPEDFYYSIFKLQSNGSPIKLLNFGHQPIDFISGIATHYKNKKNTPQMLEFLEQNILKYLVSFPLMTACSLSVENRDVAFVEEYIFPQQLLLWLRDRTNYDGILYRTCSSIEKARDWSYINLVMPARQITSQGYCEYLNNLFVISEPKRVSLCGLVKGRHDAISKVKRFVSELEGQSYNHFALYPYRELLSLCKTFIHLTNMLANGNYVNGEAIYQTIETLNLYAYIIKEHRESILSNAQKELERSYSILDKNELLKKSSEILDAFESNVCPVLFDFWDYTFMCSEDSGDMGKQYEHAFETNKKISKKCFFKKLEDKLKFRCKRRIRK